MRPSPWQQRVGLTTVNYSSSASHLATALLDPCMLLFLPVPRLTTERLKGLISALCLPVAKLTAARPNQCPMPPCCKASCLDPMVWSGLCFIPLASAAHPTRGPNALERRGLWSGLVCVLYTTEFTSYHVVPRGFSRYYCTVNPRYLASFRGLPSKHLQPHVL